MNYWKKLGKAFKIFQKNPILILPPVLGIIASTIVVGLFMLFGGLLLTLSTNLSIEEAIYSLNSQIIIGILFIVALIVLWFVNTYFTAGFFGMVYESLKKKTNIKNFNVFAKKYYYNLLSYTIIKNLIIFIISIPLLIGVYLAFTNPAIISALLGLLGFILLVLTSIFMGIWLLFAPQLIVSKNIEGVSVFKKSWQLLKKNKIHFIKTFLVVIVSNLGVMALSLLITLPLEMYNLQSWSQTISMFFNLIQGLLNIVVAIYLFLMLKN